MLYEERENFHGQVGWMPRLQGGEESRPSNHIYISRKLRPVGGELHFVSPVSKPVFQSRLLRVPNPRKSLEISKPLEVISKTVVRN
jgi:hypothetical protein